MFGVLIMILQFDDEGKIRSSIGIGVDWFTVVGPLNFTLAHSI